MNNFVQALQTKDTFTENGMPTHSTSGNYLLDMFYKMGGSKNSPESDLVQMLVNSLSYDALLTMKAVFYNRDVRGGQGIRKTFRVFLHWLAANYPDLVRKNLHLIPEYGYWKDVFSLYDTQVWPDALKLIRQALSEENGLCAKYLPREGKKDWNTVGRSVCSFMRLSPRDYRKMVVRLTNVVETAMCNREWQSIRYESVPSVCMKRNRKAFIKNDGTRFNGFIQKVLAGKTTIKASTLYPSDLVEKLLQSYSQYTKRFSSLAKAEIDAIQAQWNALPDYMPEGLGILPVCDVSGSMSGEPLNVSVALGIYLSERNTGPFKDAFITFSGDPTLQYLTSSHLDEKVLQLARAHWQMNTDLGKVFDLILNKAIESKLSPADMPKFLLIISDMQFDQATRGSTALEMIKNKYIMSGYEVPNVIFWNVRTSSGVPIKMTDKGVALVSGYSPSVMMQVTSGELNPMNLMLKTLNSERYSAVRI